MRARMHLTTEIRKMAERGLEIMSSDTPQARRRLREYRDFYAFFEREFPALMNKWEKRRAER